MIEDPIKSRGMSDETTIAVTGTPRRCCPAYQVLSSLIAPSEPRSSLIAVS